MRRLALWSVAALLGQALIAGPAQAQAIPIARADVNGDCVVNQTDLNLVIASYNKRTGQPGFNPAADVNRDGAVTLTDRTFVQRALGTQVCTPPQPPPTIAAAVTPAANANGWHRDPVTVAFTCTGAVSCPAPVTVTAEGAGQVIERTVTNSQGVTATARATISLDRTAPVLTATMAASGAPGTSVALTVTGVDLSGLGSVQVEANNVAVGTATAAPFALAVPVAPVAGQIRSVEIIGTDRAGNAASLVRALASAAPDATLPIAFVNVVAVAAPGAVIPVRASATDAGGLTRLALSQVEAGVITPLAEQVAAPFALQSSFTLPQAADATVVTFLARAEDASGNVGTATASVTIRETVDSGTLQVTVDPPVSPTFQSSTILRGRLGGGVTSAPPVPPAFLAGLSINQGRLGQTLDVGVTGVNTTFQAGLTQATFGSGVTVQQITVQSPTSLVLRVQVDARAPLGPRLLALSTGTQEAILPHAFSVVAGLGSVAGRLVTTTGAAIAQGTVCLAGTTVCGQSDATGAFSIADAPTTAGRVVATATGFQSGQAIVSLTPGGNAAVGNIVLEASLELPPPPPPNGPTLAPQLALGLARMYIAQVDPLTLTPERARQTVIESILLVGADELGVTDADGRQLNADIAGSGLMTLDDRGVTLQARGLRQGATVSLEELAYALAVMFEWSATPFTVDELVSTLQARVNEAWAAPTADGSQLALLLFNQGPTLSPVPPRVSAQTRINTLQAFLITSGVMLQGYHDLRPQGTARVEPAAVTPARPGLFARLGGWASGAARLVGAGGASARAARSGLQTRWQPVDPSIEPRRARPFAGVTPATLAQGPGGPPTHRVRQLSRMLTGAKESFARSVAQNLLGAVLFSLPAAAAGGGITAVTLIMSVVGAFSDVFLFSAFIPVIAKMAPPPPAIESVRQAGNKVIVRVARVPLDWRCRTGLAEDPESQKGLCNFQYTLYRYGGGAGNRVVKARYVPPAKEDVGPGIFEMEDPFPQAGVNWYYADVIHKLPLEVPEALNFFAGTLSLPVRIPIPVGNIIGLFFLSELISDFSEPNPIPLLNFNNNTSLDYDRVRVTFVPVPPTSNFTALRTDVLGGVFGNDFGLRQFSQHVPGQTVSVLRPGFGAGVGLATDPTGKLYSVSALSQGQFGGRVFQVRRDGSQHLVGSVNRYSALLGYGNPSDVSALAFGPGLPSAAGAFVPGDIYAADNSDRTIKRLHTSIIPAVGISGLPAPGAGIFGAAAAVPIIGQPWVRFPECTGQSAAIRDLVFDRNRQNLYTIVGSQLYRIPYDTQSAGAGQAEVAATLNGMQVGSGNIDIRVRNASRSSAGTALRGRLLMTATATGGACSGTFTWRSTDDNVASVRVVRRGPGTSEVEVIGRQPGVVTITASYQGDGQTTPIDDTIEVTVYESGPILFVHGWIGKGSGWEPVISRLESDKGLNRGGSLCASWVRDRGRWARVQNSNGSFRPGNHEQYVCDEAATDGSVFTLNFDDAQNRFIDTAGELADIVDQIMRRVGGAECGTLAGETATLPATCPKLTIVAHSMGGQTTRAYIQSVPHGGFTVSDHGAGGTSGPLRLPMPFRPFSGQVGKFVSIGTMYLGTPGPLLADDQSLIFFGVSSILNGGSAAANMSIDSFSSAIRSMGVESTELQLMQTYNLHVLRGLEITSIVTQAPASFSSTVCNTLGGGAAGVALLLTRFPAWVITALTALAQGLDIADFAINPLARTHERLCGAGNPAIAIPVLGSTSSAVSGLPFMPNSDEIVGVDSQNANNLFRMLDQGQSGIVHVCRDEEPGQFGGPARVVCQRDMLHTEDTAAADTILPQLDLDTPTSPSNSNPQFTVDRTQTSLPAVAALASPRYLAADASDNLFVADAAGSVTIVQQNGTAHTFLSGLAGLGPIAVQDGFLYAVRSGDVLRIPLGISGQILLPDGTPARGASVLVRAPGGGQERTVVTDGNGEFTVPLESLSSVVTPDQIVLLLTITTQGSSTSPSQTYSVNVGLALNEQRERSHTVVQMTLPANP